MSLWFQARVRIFPPIYWQTDAVCGTSHWMAAKTSSKRMGKLAETGLYLASCRHQLLLKAVNMFQGEIFAYPLYIQDILHKESPIEFFCQDVICKYWPWLHRMSLKMPEFSCLYHETSPFLSVMHGKAHSWTCQVRQRKEPLWVYCTFDIDIKKYSYLHIRNRFGIIKVATVLKDFMYIHFSERT